MYSGIQVKETLLVQVGRFQILKKRQNKIPSDTNIQHKLIPWVRAAYFALAVILYII